MRKRKGKQLVNRRAQCRQASQPSRAPVGLRCVLEQVQALRRARVGAAGAHLCLPPPSPCPPVIDGLDLLKKEHPGARDGIRYLEAEFKKGNR